MQLKETLDKGTILEKNNIANNIYEMKVYSPRIAEAARPGQFMILMVDETGERVPMTIVDWNEVQGWVDIVYQQVGTTTAKLSSRNAGDKLFYVAGPLGKPSSLGKFGNIIVVGGGVGIPAIYPIARALRSLGNHVVAIIGAKTASALIYEDKMKMVSDELIITTDDGSKAMTRSCFAGSVCVALAGLR